MSWKYEELAVEFIRAFAREALSDARELREVRMGITGSGGRWTVDADIPTSTHPCWLAFEIQETASAEAKAIFQQALRSGKEPGDENVYTWDPKKNAWQLVQS